MERVILQYDDNTEDFLVIKFAERCRTIAKDNNIKIGDLEGRIGMALGYFSRIISGEQKGMSLRIAFKICRVLGMSIEEILNYKNRDEEIAQRLNDTILKDLLKDFSKDEIINYIKYKG